MEKGVCNIPVGWEKHYVARAYAYQRWVKWSESMENSGKEIITVTKKELEQLMDLKKEINELEQSILKIEQMDIEAIPVKVDASSKNFPYIQGKMTVQSYNPALANRRANLLYSKRVLLEERKRKVTAEEIKLLQYINQIEESKIRRIMQFRFVEGLTWEKIGGIMHCDRTTVEKMVNRYLKRNNKIK